MIAAAQALALLRDKLAAHEREALLVIDPLQRQTYQADLTEERGDLPLAVLRPRNLDEVAECVRDAGAAGIRLLPVVANTNVGALAVPHGDRCVMLDLNALNRIVELNRADRYVVVEPGVSWQQLKDRLDREAPELRFGYPLAPPESSVLAGCVLDGLGNLSLRHGSMNSWINGLEVILPSGEQVVTGTRAWAPDAPWCCRGPLPDLTGLFLNFQGTTGVVTKASLQLWRNPPCRRRYFCLVPQAALGLDTIAELAAAELCDDLAALSWPLGRLLLGAVPELRAGAGEPEFFVYADLSGEDEEEVDMRERRLRSVLRGRWPDYEQSFFPIQWVVGLDPAFQALAEFPTRLGFLLDHPGGGLSWVGTYGPLSRWREGAEIGMRTMVELGFPPSMVARPMHGGHFCVLRFVATFDREDAQARRRVRALNEALLDPLLALGFLPYKTPRWALRRKGDALQAGYARLLRRVVDLLDPHDRLDSGRWRL